MPNLQNVTASYSRKIQLEQFEPVSHSVTLEVELEDGDDPDEVYDEYSDKAEDMVERQIAARVTQKKLQSDDSESS